VSLDSVYAALVVALFRRALLTRSLFGDSECRCGETVSVVCPSCDVPDVGGVIATDCLLRLFSDPVSSVVLSRELTRIREPVSENDRAEKASSSESAFQGLRVHKTVCSCGGSAIK
jgi:hypothetical protein